MDDFESVMEFIDYAIDTPRKRHMVGGILLSVSMLFGRLAFTVISFKNEEEI